MLKVVSPEYRLAFILVKDHTRYFSEISPADQGILQQLGQLGKKASIIILIRTRLFFPF